MLPLIIFSQCAHLGFLHSAVGCLSAGACSAGSVFQIHVDLSSFPVEKSCSCLCASRMSCFQLGIWWLLIPLRAQSLSNVL